MTEAEKYFRERAEKIGLSKPAKKLKRLADDVKQMCEWAASAKACLDRGVELMPTHHISKWEGVRAVIESFPETDEKGNL